MAGETTDRSLAEFAQTLDDDLPVELVLDAHVL